MKHYKFNKFYKPFTAISAVLVIISLLLLGIKGLNLGIDFKGGTLIELRAIDKQINISSLRNSFSKMNLGDVAIKNFGNDKDFLIKFEKKGDNKSLIQNIKKKLDAYLGTGYEIRRVENVGPKVSNELLKGGLIAIAASLGAMLFYIWIRFEWQFSIGSIIALFHDVIITLGIFSFLSLEINLSIIAAVLTIVGYSMNDTVVIYDRIRENLGKFHKLDISDIANLSINETLARTIITSVTTLLALLSIFILGGEILRGFSFAMILGVLIGTYSSIFVASPILKYFKVSYKTIEKEEEKIVP